MLKAFLAAIIGAVIAFGWSSISWMVLPLHKNNMKSFENSSAVAEMIQKEVTEPGIYVLPSCEIKDQEARTKALADGPAVFASIRPGADPDFNMGKMMLRGFTATLVASFILAILLGAVAPRLNYAGRVGFVLLIAILICIVGLYPNQIWWEFSSGFVLANMLDTVVGWTLAGLVMGGMINGK